MITVTDSAVKQLQTLLAEHSDSANKGLRIFVEAGGCAGMQYGMALDVQKEGDEIIKRETLLGDNQKTVEYRDEKIDGDKATLKFKNQSGSWEMLPFVREDGVWKIDKQGYANQMMKDILEKQNQAFGADTESTATPEDLQPQE